ncbi:DUF4393 domain-containing protein [Sphingomonas sp. JC676]|uniref:Abi-alpha family protein n=1 Tax=Sphingomonas sp. JC676 TaxID=2768065 RepID=UPI0016579E3F|nr:Abi-alpha family protein [Sphingomonas sp. JC676]MBC9033978.1 DUF4393 domain-containing protein [Sphingomonas sp. JC676]
MTSDGKSLDILGIKPLADAALIVVKGTVDGAGAFLGRICLPAAEEFGLLLRDKVNGWRTQNATNIANAAERILSERENLHELHAHPRIVGRILEQGSWEDSEQVQQMWAGLLASSCDADGKSQGNLIFIGLLEQITSSQAILLEHACNIAVKRRSKSGFILADSVYLPIEVIMSILGISDLHQADVELDHMREIGLLTPDSGFQPNDDSGDITPSSLGLNFYARCQGYVGSVTDFFEIPPNNHAEVDGDQSGERA